MEQLQAHYRRRDEWDRLQAGNGRVEFVRTQELLRAVLPPPPARLLDVGGADGIHAVWLTGDGYEVTIIDPLEDHVQRARDRGLGARVGDARSLDEADDYVDAVLLLGPLYHLHDRGDRLRALREARRVARSGSVVAVAAISRVSVLLDGLRKGFAATWRDGVARVVKDGVDPQDPAIEVFYFHTPDELVEELREVGLVDVTVRGVEGPAWAMIDRHLAADDPMIDVVVEIARLVDGDRSVVGASAHLLAIGSVP